MLAAAPNIEGCEGAELAVTVEPNRAGDDVDGVLLEPNVMPSCVVLVAPPNALPRVAVVEPNRLEPPVLAGAPKEKDDLDESDMASRKVSPKVDV